MSRKISEISLAGVDDLTIARDSVHKIRRVSEDSLQNFFELDTENVFRLFYLRVSPQVALCLVDTNIFAYRSSSL